MASIYSLASSPSDRRFAHYDTARSFNTVALECEDYTSFAAHSPPSHDIDARANTLWRKYTEFIERTGIEHREYGNAKQEELTKRLKEILRIERMIGEEVA
jgi:hypothetical protein